MAPPRISRSCVIHIGPPPLLISHPGLEILPTQELLRSARGHAPRRIRQGGGGGPAHAAGAYFKEEDHSTDAVVKEEGRSEGRHNLRGVEASDAVFITGYGPASILLYCIP